MTHDVNTFYKDKTILITGATGFVGKAILWHVLQWEISKVYVLIRPKRIPAGTPSQRVIDEIINTLAFQQYDKDSLREKLIPIAYDLSLPQMGLSMEDTIKMKDTNIIIHCASTSEYEASLEWNLETNVLGTIRLMEYVENLSNVCAFAYLSPVHLYQDIPEFCYDCEIKEYVYDLGFGDPETCLKQLLGANEKELVNLTKRILSKYTTLYYFTKALIEHLMLKRIEHMKTRFPIAIFRSNYIGPALKTPVPGWTSGMSGVSLWLALFAHAIPVIQPDQGAKYVHVTPVDEVAQRILRTLPELPSPPPPPFVLPLAQIMATIGRQVPTFPSIYNITTSPITWYEAYTYIQDYWSRPNNLVRPGLVPADAYFSSNTTLSNARFLLNYYQRTPSTKVDVLPQGDTKWIASQIKTNLAKQNRHPWRFGPHTDTWSNHDYFMQSCYGVHVHTLHCGPHVRTSVYPSYMDCALYASKRAETFRSVIYTQEETRHRVQQMIQMVIQSLKQPKKTKSPVWIEYLNDMLEDWCTYHPTSVSNEENTKLVVLNDPQVGEAIQQVSKRSGMTQEKVMEEAIKTFNRIQARSQPTYVQFAFVFLELLFKKMFSGIYVKKQSLEGIPSRCVYVPVSRTALDPVIVWFICMRYDLPVPLMVLDEALAVLGPLSDILRLAGAVFVKRDPQQRSMLSHAVTSAYLRHLAHKGALTLVMDRVRSRTGVQVPFQDGLIDQLDVAYVPITVGYEEVMDIAQLVDEDLQTHQKRTISATRMSTPITRPSERSHRVRSRSLGTGVVEEKSTVKVMQCGKLLVGIGKPVTKVEEIQKEQKKAVIVSPVSMVAAILLYSRVGGSSMDLQEIKYYLKYLSGLIKKKNVLLDMQDFESGESVIFYSIRLLEKNLDTVTLDQRNSGFTFRLSSRTDCILQLAYYANQIREVFMYDSLFAVVYLSFGTRTKVIFGAFYERFEFLSRLFQQHFNTTWSIEEEFDKLKEEYSDCISDEREDHELEDILEEHEEDQQASPRMLRRLVQSGKRYHQLCLLASFVYPIIDSYWVTLCGLSALNLVGKMPISIVPILSQWIGMHLLSGRRTIYGEVLSIEYHQHVLRTLQWSGVLNKESAKDVVLPDTQMLMQVLGLSTHDQMISFANESDLYKKIEQVRVKLEGNSASIHIYEKCQNQIKSLIKSSIGKKPFTKSHGAVISDTKEEHMLQLAYALIQTMNNPLFQ